MISVNLYQDVPLADSLPPSLHAVLPPSATSLCGQVGLLYFLEVALDKRQVHKLYEAGSLFDGTFEDVGISNRILACADPVKYEKQGMVSTDLLMLKEPDKVAESKQKKCCPLFAMEFSNYFPIPFLADYFELPLESIPLISLQPDIFSKFKTMRTPKIDSNFVDGFSDVDDQNLSPYPYGSQSPSFATISATALFGCFNSIVDSYDLVNSIMSKNKSFQENGTDSFTTSSLLTAISIASMNVMPQVPAFGVVEMSPVRVVDVHLTKEIKVEIHEAFSAAFSANHYGVFLCFPLLSFNSAQHIAALRIIASLLECYPTNKRCFDTENGFNIIGHLLAAQVRASGSTSSIFSTRELSIETFDILFGMTHGKVMESVPIAERKLHDLNGLQLILDLCRNCDSYIRKHGLVSLLTMKEIKVERKCFY